MQQTALIRHAQSQRNKKKNDGRKHQRKTYDKAKVCWTTRGNTTPKTTDSKQYMESTDTTTISAAASTYGIQNDATTHYATTDDAYSTTAADGNGRDADSPNAIWSTATATTVENDVTVRGGEYMQ